MAKIEEKMLFVGAGLSGLSTFLEALINVCEVNQGIDNPDERVLPELTLVSNRPIGEESFVRTQMFRVHEEVVDLIKIQIGEEIHNKMIANKDLVPYHFVEAGGLEEVSVVERTITPSVVELGGGLKTEEAYHAVRINELEKAYFKRIKSLKERYEAMGGKAYIKENTEVKVLGESEVSKGCVQVDFEENRSSYAEDYHVVVNGSGGRLNTAEAFNARPSEPIRNDPIGNYHATVSFEIGDVTTSPVGDLATNRDDVITVDDEAIRSLQKYDMDIDPEARIFSASNNIYVGVEIPEEWHNSRSELQQTLRKSGLSADDNELIKARLASLDQQIAQYALAATIKTKGMRWGDYILRACGQEGGTLDAGKFKTTVFPVALKHEEHAFRVLDGGEDGSIGLFLNMGDSHLNPHYQTGSGAVRIIESSHKFGEMLRYRFEAIKGAEEGQTAYSVLSSNHDVNEDVFYDALDEAPSEGAEDAFYNDGYLGALKDFHSYLSSEHHHYLEKYTFFRSQRDISNLQAIWQKITQAMEGCGSDRLKE
ncbi:MAG: hypothetical protein VXW87_04710, partial [Pseudomonadota bacterium]|nr:hypothetical protein [Pseudomonadota bacterium]